MALLREVLSHRATSSCYSLSIITKGTPGSRGTTQQPMTPGDHLGLNWKAFTGEPLVLLMQKQPTSYHLEFRRLQTNPFA